MRQFSHVEVRKKRRQASRAAKTLGSSEKDYTQITPQKPHKWTLEEQITLILLVRRYENTWADKKRIFNSYIEVEPNSPHYFTEAALRAMCQKLGSKFSDPLGNWSCVREALERKAALLCIPLVDCAEAKSPQTACQVSSGLPTPIRNRKLSTRFPRLGFRAFDISNQGTNCSTHFRAGRFVNGDIPRPPNPRSFAYRNDARRQIERIHEGVTPFISTTSSLLRALSYAYGRNHPSSIAIIDLHKAGRVTDYEDDNNPFLQNVYRLKLKPDDWYKGRSEFLIYGEIKEDAILCVVTLSQLMSHLPSLSNNDDPFGLEHLQPSEPLRESSKCICELSECSCRTSKPLQKVRSLLRKNTLPTNFSSGRIVGNLLKALNIPTDYLNEGISIVAKDWNFHTWRNNSQFKNGVVDGFRENGLAKFPDLDQIGCSRLKATLKKATAMIYPDAEEMCWSPDTITEDSTNHQEPPEFSFNEFVRELRSAAVTSGQTRA